MVETTEVKKDSHLEKGKAPADGDGITPPEVYSKTQVEEAIQKDRIARGRDDKTLTGRETAVKAREDAAKAEEDRRDAAELKEAQGDPDKLAVYQAKQAERQRTRKQDERDAAQDKRDADYEAETRESTREILIHEVATAKGVDPVRLKTLSGKYNVEGKEKLEELADDVAAGKFKGFEADNAMTKGTKTDLSSLSAQEKLNKGFSETKK